MTTACVDIISTWLGIVKHQFRDPRAVGAEGLQLNALGRDRWLAGGVQEIQSEAGRDAGLIYAELDEAAVHLNERTTMTAKGRRGRICAVIWIAHQLLT